MTWFHQLRVHQRAEVDLVTLCVVDSGSLSACEALKMWACEEVCVGFCFPFFVPFGFGAISNINFEYVTHSYVPLRMINNSYNVYI